MPMWSRRTGAGSDSSLATTGSGLRSFWNPSTGSIASFGIRSRTSSVPPSSLWPRHASAAVTVAATIVRGPLATGFCKAMRLTQPRKDGCGRSDENSIRSPSKTPSKRRSERFSRSLYTPVALRAPCVPRLPLLKQKTSPIRVSSIFEATTLNPRTCSVSFIFEATGPMAKARGLRGDFRSKRNPRSDPNGIRTRATTLKGWGANHYTMGSD